MACYFPGILALPRVRFQLIFVLQRYIAVDHDRIIDLHVALDRKQLGVLFGLGYGAFSSVDWALTIDALPSLKEAGKHLGLWNASTTIPAIIAPLLGSSIISIAGGHGYIDQGYRLVFACAAGFLIVAAIGILFVRESR